MKIVLDLQGGQSSGLHNSVQRYSLDLARAIVQNRGKHEVILALNGFYSDTIEPIRAAFDDLLPQDNIRVWYPPKDSTKNTSSRQLWSHEAAARIWLNFLSCLKPDIVHLSQPFTARSEKTFAEIAALEKTIPFGISVYNTSMAEKLQWASLLFEVSCTVPRRNPTAHLPLAAHSSFKPLSLPEERVTSVLTRYGLNRSYILSSVEGKNNRELQRLIEVYALLSAETRKKHQLVIFGDISATLEKQLRQKAENAALSNDQLLLLDTLHEHDLVYLYNLAELFVFFPEPGFFNLSALEALSCGCAVMAPKTSTAKSLINSNHALFDPGDTHNFVSRLTAILNNTGIGKEIAAYGLEQSRLYSREKSGKDAVAKFESWHEQIKPLPALTHTTSAKPKLAFVSPLPPEHSGISDYSTELLPELSVHYDVDVIVDQKSISNKWIRQHCPARSVEWFKKNARSYERVMYHFGNSPFHKHMFRLLEEVPGVVVLHDFFLSGIVAHMDIQKIAPGFWQHELFHSHGYQGIKEYYNTPDRSEIVDVYPSNLSVLENALGVIVHSEYSRQLAAKWYPGLPSAQWSVIPHLRTQAPAIDRTRARRSLRFREDDFIICSFGLLGPHKLNHRLLDAWLDSSLAESKNCHLIFVGSNDRGDYGRNILETIDHSRVSERIRITGWADMKTFRQYLAAADIAVQLRTLSRGETSGTVLDCMNYGVPLIVNENGSMAELPSDCLIKLQDDFFDTELVEALEKLEADNTLRDTLRTNSLNHIQSAHNPSKIAALYVQAVERFYQSPNKIRHDLIKQVAEISSLTDNDQNLLDIAEAIATSFPRNQAHRQLLVDISALAQEDLKTGIQRVVRSILINLITTPPRGFRVEPVYATHDRPYRYARKFTMRLLGCPDNDLVDELVEIQPRDILFIPDLHFQVAIKHNSFVQKLRNIGGQAIFLVHDILPVKHPEFFPEGTLDEFEKWLQVVSQADGAICVTKAVADDLHAWIKRKAPRRDRPFSIGWNHHGANIEDSIPSKGLPENFEQSLKKISYGNTVLMVGTVEPRKGHMQALQAMEILWNYGLQANLVIVGKHGWMVDEIAERINSHHELQKRLFWFQGISDEALLKLYENANGVLMASKGEGFGLPLIEAAQHGCPILAKDIPVFREVCGEYASYFSGNTPIELADALKKWLEQLKRGTASESKSMPWLTWKASTENLVALLTDDQHRNWTYRWRRSDPDNLTDQ